MRTLIIAAILASAVPARAQDVGVVVTGEATLQPGLAAALETWLREHGHRLESSPLEPDATNTLIDCFVLEDLNCARGVIDRRAKSQAVVFARVEVTQTADGGRDITIIGYWLEKGHDAIAERRTCSKCAGDKLDTTTDDLMTALAAEPPAPAPNATPGPTPVPPRPIEISRPSRLVPEVVIGGGAALAITGIVLIAVDKKPSATGVQKATYTSTAPPGYGLVIAGGLAIGTGIYLWLRQGSSSAPVAAVSRDGAVVGWSGRF
ncbi:MAG TPA: hypothetical protein VLX92_06540 [Kofleriaceae bacterium]|nr:hypothetical protein [Kofleriaceae bacterium]